LQQQQQHLQQQQQQQQQQQLGITLGIGRITPTDPEGDPDRSRSIPTDPD
jgi:hypothetical protein